MKKYIFLVLLLSACATNSHLYNDENGNPVYKANCSGSYLSFAECLEVMGKTCPTGFNVLMSSEQQVGTYSDYNLTGGTSGNINSSFYGTGSINGHLNNYGNYGTFNSNSNFNAFGNSQFNSRSNYNMGGYTMANINRYVIYSCKIIK